MSNNEENEMQTGNQLPGGDGKQTTGDNTIKNPDDWTTGDEPMTGAQGSYLKTLSDEAGEEFNEKLTKSEASKRIDELQHKTGRGLNTDPQQAKP